MKIKISALSLCINFLFIVLVNGEEIVLKNGKIIEGEIVSEKNNFIELLREGKKIVVLKSLVDSVNGEKYLSGKPDWDLKPQEPKPADTKIHPKKQNPSDSGLPVSAVFDGIKSGMEVSLTLKNGTVLKGKILSMNSNFLKLDLYGTAVSILKKLVQKISISGGGLADDKTETGLPRKDKVQREETAGKGEDVIIMKNGTVMKGKIVMRGINFIRLAIDNSSVDILKTMIEKINGKQLLRKKDAVNKHDESFKKQNRSKVQKQPETTDAEKSEAAAVRPFVKKESGGLSGRSGRLPEVETVRPDSGMSVSENRKLTEPGKTKVSERTIEPEDNKTGPGESSVNADHKERDFQPRDNKKPGKHNDSASENLAHVSSMNIKSTGKAVPDDGFMPGDRIDAENSRPASIETFRQLINRMKTGDASQRIKAAVESARYENAGNELLEILSDLLSDSAKGKALMRKTADSKIEIYDTPGKAAAYALSTKGENVIKIIERELRRRDPVTRRNAASALVNIQEVRSTEILIELMGDEDPEVQSIVKQEIIYRRPVEALMSSLKSRSNIVKKNALEILGRLGVKEGERYFTNALNSSNSEVREMAVYALREAGCKNAVEHVLQMLNDRISFVRAEAAKTLGAFRVKGAVKHLIPLLRDRSAVVREEAARALGQYRDTRSIEPLVLASKDENREVRQAAGESLKLHTDIEELIKVVDSEEDILRENAAYILFLMTGKDYGSNTDKWNEWLKNREK